MGDERKVQVVTLDERVAERQVFTGRTPPPVRLDPAEMRDHVVTIRCQPISRA